jgi:O-antigen/teichoic acid export membrane protein
LENTSTTKIRKILQNFGYLTFGKSLGDFFTFLLFVVFSRVFGQEGIGQYSFAMAFTGFFAVLADFGLNGLSIKELSRLDEHIGRHAGRFLTLRICFSVLAFTALALLLPILPFSQETKHIILFIGLYQILYRILDGFLAVYIAREDTHIAGTLDALFRGSTALVGCAIIYLQGTMITTVASLPVVTAIQILTTYALLIRRYGAPSLASSLRKLMDMVREAFPYALSVLLFQVRSRIDVVFLTFIIDATAAGIYNVAYRIIFMLSFIPHFGALSLFPYASRLYVQSKSELSNVYSQALSAAIIIGMPVAAGVWLVAPEIISIVFGEEFTGSIMVLRLLAWLLFLMFVLRILVTFLVSCDLQVEVTRKQFVAGVVNILGNAVLIYFFGLLGAACATLLAESLLVLLYFIRLNEELGWPNISQRLFISIVGVASFCIPFSIVDELSLFVVIPASVGIYLLTLAIFRETREHEFNILFNFVRRR